MKEVYYWTELSSDMIRNDNEGIAFYALIFHRETKTVYDDVFIFAWLQQFLPPDSYRVRVVDGENCGYSVIKAGIVVF